MIKLLTYKNSVGLTLSGIIYICCAYFIPDFSAQKIGLTALLFCEGVMLNYLCFRFSILRQKTALPALLFALFSALFIVDLTLEFIVYGALFLSAFYLSFRAKEIPSYAKIYLIYLGIIIGISQAFYNQSILFFIPIMILFIQVGIINFRGFIMALVNLSMVIACAVSIYFLMDSPQKIMAMIPGLTSTNHPIEIDQLKVASPVILFSIVFHLFKISSYSFRFPNLSKNINYTFLTQFILGLITAFIFFNQNIIIYPLMALAVVLSFMFVYLEKRLFVNALFLALIITILSSLYFCRIIFL